MSYASDTDDLEQIAQGNDKGESMFEEFCQRTFGCYYGEMSLREQSDARFQWGMQKK